MCVFRRASGRRGFVAARFLPPGDPFDLRLEVGHDGGEYDDGRDDEERPILGDQTGQKRGDQPRHRTDQDARGQTGALSHAKAQTDAEREPGTRPHEDILVYACDRVTERYDDDGHAGCDANAEPGQPAESP